LIVASGFAARAHPLRTERHRLISPKAIHLVQTQLLLESRGRRTRFVTVINRSLRALWLLCAIAIVGLTLPVRAEMAGAPVHRSDCCAHMAAHGHCGGQPATAPSSSERPCCAVCLFALPFLEIAPAAYVFNLTAGETLRGVSLARHFRPARPLVPPPRA